MTAEIRPPQEAVDSDGRLILDAPVTLPSILDLLIVGAGPFGTAAAFRARELGLAALVVDHDDILKRIRDYAKDKLILPDYGGGDAMAFPEGGELIRSLEFDPIDKDELCKRWKGLYRRHSIPVQIGIELVGLRRTGDTWAVEVMNHNREREETILARHVAIGVGRGVPRQLEVPGDLTGLSFFVRDAGSFVGSPVCVIGGGTSAAEAVIAISHAKARVSDGTGVYWSHRGQTMPKVSQALAGVFFEAFVGNGNIRYLPCSEPVSASGTGPTGRLAVRTERTEFPLQPAQVTVLEFLKTHSVACIGEDLPETLLKRLGIPLVTNETGKKRVLVTPLLETREADVYLAGDTLSPMFLETSDFADLGRSREVRRRGNIKAAMRDGVVVAGAVAQRLAGRQFIRVDLTRAEPLELHTEGNRRPPNPIVHRPDGTARLVTLLPTGVEAAEFVLTPGQTTTIGRMTGDVVFPVDELMSDRHAEITSTHQGFIVRDVGSARGTLLRPTAMHAVEIAAPATVFAGRQWFVVGDNDLTEVAHCDAAGNERARFPLGDGPTIVGREAPGITVAVNDRSMSRRHFSVSRQEGRLVIRDLGSSNGSFLRVVGDVRLENGDCLIVGQQTLRFVRDDLSASPASVIEVDMTTIMASRQSRATVDVPVGPPEPPGPSVLFEGQGRAVTCSKAEVICDVAKRLGLRMDADCRQGVCGMDPIRIVSGAEHLSQMGRTERDTLEDLCGLDPRTHRMACMAKVAGPVAIAIVRGA